MKTTKLIFFVSVITLSLPGCGRDKTGNKKGIDPSIPIVVGTDKSEPLAMPQGTAVPSITPLSDARANQPVAAQTPDSNNPINTPIATNSPAPQPPEPIPPEPTVPTSPKTRLKVTVENLANQDGIVCFAAFKGPEGFPDDSAKTIAASCFEITTLPLVFTLEGLELGTYGMALWHDENRDGKLNKSIIGIPKEGLGFSNRAGIRLAPPGPPPFSETAFEVKEGDNETASKINYLLR